MPKEIKDMPYLIHIGGNNLYMVEIDDYIKFGSDDRDSAPEINTTKEGDLEEVLKELLEYEGSEYRINLLWTRRNNFEPFICNPLERGTNFDFFVTSNNHHNKRYKRFSCRHSDNHEREIFYKNKPTPKKVGAIFGNCKSLEIHYVGSPKCEFETERDDSEIYLKWVELQEKKERNEDRKMLFDFLPTFRKEFHIHLLKASNYELEILNVLSNRLSDTELEEKEDFEKKDVILHRITYLLKNVREEMHPNDDYHSELNYDKIADALEKLSKKGILKKGKNDKDMDTYCINPSALDLTIDRIKRDLDVGQGHLFPPEILIGKEI